jgi:hypothetical protein
MEKELSYDEIIKMNIGDKIRHDANDNHIYLGRVIKISPDVKGQTIVTIAYWPEHVYDADSIDNSTIIHIWPDNTLKIYKI